jgi:hypothetical protein
MLDEIGPGPRSGCRLLLSRLRKGQHSLAGREDGGWTFERLIEPPPQVAMGEEVHPEQRDQVRERPGEARRSWRYFRTSMAISAVHTVHTWTFKALGVSSTYSVRRVDIVRGRVLEARAVHGDPRSQDGGSVAIQSSPEMLSHAESPRSGKPGLGGDPGVAVPRMSPGGVQARSSRPERAPPRGLPWCVFEANPSAGMAVGQFTALRSVPRLGSRGP